jgi:hypothetical protein
MSDAAWRAHRDAVASRDEQPAGTPEHVGWRGTSRLSRASAQPSCESRERKQAKKAARRADRE